MDGLAITCWWQWAALLLGGFLIGIAKTGLPGVGILVVPLLALAFDAKPSVGLLLPILIFADIFAVTYYRRHGEWKHLLKLLPWALVGIGVGFFVLKVVESAQLKPIIGAIVLVMLGLRLRALTGKQQDVDHVPHHWLFAASMGTAAGATTMMANAAGHANGQDQICRNRGVVFLYRQLDQGAADGGLGNDYPRIAQTGPGGTAGSGGRGVRGYLAAEAHPAEAVQYDRFRIGSRGGSQIAVLATIQNTYRK